MFRSFVSCYVVSLGAALLLNITLFVHSYLAQPPVNMRCAWHRCQLNSVHRTTSSSVVQCKRREYSHQILKANERNKNERSQRMVYLTTVQSHIYAVPSSFLSLFIRLSQMDRLSVPYVLSSAFTSSHQWIWQKVAADSSGVTTDNFCVRVCVTHLVNFSHSIPTIIFLFFLVVVIVVGPNGKHCAGDKTVGLLFGPFRLFLRSPYRQHLLAFITYFRRRLLHLTACGVPAATVHCARETIASGHKWGRRKGKTIWRWSVGVSVVWLCTVSWRRT